MASQEEMAQYVGARESHEVLLQAECRAWKLKSCAVEILWHHLKSSRPGHPLSSLPLTNTYLEFWRTPSSLLKLTPKP